MADRPFSGATPSALSDAMETLTARLSDALATVLPAGADWQSRLAPVVEATLGRLELVPREDFERQRAQLERLVRDVARLEARISALDPGTPR
jgi:BMFP domain-containing protein YqiC